MYQKFKLHKLDALTVFLTLIVISILFVCSIYAKKLIVKNIVK